MLDIYLRIHVILVIRLVICGIHPPTWFHEREQSRQLRPDIIPVGGEKKDMSLVGMWSDMKKMLVQDKGQIGVNTDYNHHTVLDFK